MKRIFLCTLIAFIAISCTKDKSAYYINQEHDPDLVGVWMFDHGEGYYISYTEYTADGKMITGEGYHSDGKISWHSVITYWYSKDGVIYEYEYHGAWSNDLKSQYPYYFSEDKMQLYIMVTPYSTPFTRVESVE